MNGRRTNGRVWERDRDSRRHTRRSLAASSSRRLGLSQVAVRAHDVDARPARTPNTRGRVAHSAGGQTLRRTKAQRTPARKTRRPGPSSSEERPHRLLHQPLLRLPQQQQHTADQCVRVCVTRVVSPTSLVHQWIGSGPSISVGSVFVREQAPAASTYNPNTKSCYMGLNYWDVFLCARTLLVVLLVQ